MDNFVSEGRSLGQQRAYQGHSTISVPPVVPGSAGGTHELDDADEDSHVSVLGVSAKRVAGRQRQVDIGKARPEYIRYVQAVPKECRTPTRPRTPDPTARVSKRQFDRQLSEWRRLLHEYDDPSAPPEDELVLAESARTGEGGSLPSGQPKSRPVPQPSAPQSLMVDYTHQASLSSTVSVAGNLGNASPLVSFSNSPGVVEPDPSLQGSLGTILPASCREAEAAAGNLRLMKNSLKRDPLEPMKVNSNRELPELSEPMQVSPSSLNFSGPMYGGHANLVNGHTDPECLVS